RPVDPSVRARADELSHSLGVMDRDVQADDATIAPADDEGVGDAEPIHESDRVLGHVVVVEITLRHIRGASVAHLLRRYDIEFAPEDGDLRAPDLNRCGPAV